MKRTPTLTAARYSFPDPGELNQRVTFRKRLDSPSDDFGTEPNDAETFRVWAKVAQTGETTYQGSVQTGEAVSHLVTIRHRKSISAEWEIVLPSGEVLRIKRQRDLNSCHRYWVLSCESLGAAENYSGDVYG